MKGTKINKTSVGSKTYDSPYSNVSTSGSGGEKGYNAAGLDIVKALPGKGKKGKAKATKKRRSY